MADSLKPGDDVSWDASQGKVQGSVERKLTKPIKIKSQKITASEADPKYLVVSKKTGAKAAHSPAALKKGGAAKGGAGAKKKADSAPSGSAKAGAGTRSKASAKQESSPAHRSARGTKKKGSA